MAQQVKDLLRSLLGDGFNPIPRSFHMPREWPNKHQTKKNKTKKKASNVKLFRRYVTFLPLHEVFKNLA